MSKIYKNCVECSKEFKWQKGKNSFYCSDECRVENLYAQNRSDPNRNIEAEKHNTTAIDPEKIYGHCNLTPTELKSTELIDIFEPYTFESEEYLYKVITEELSTARYADGSVRQNLLHKPREFYYGKRKEPVALVKKQSTKDTPSED